MINNNIYSKINNEYDLIRQKNQNLLDRRRIEVEEKIPKIKALNKKIKQNFSIALKSMLNKNADNTEWENAKKDNPKLNTKISDLLESNGYPRDYLYDIYDCNKCNDTGIVNGEKCSCYHEKLVKQLYKTSNELYKTEGSFEDFDEEIFNYDKNLKNKYLELKKHLENLSRNLGKQSKVILLLGKTGVGKTYMAQSFGKRVLETGKSVYIDSSYNLFENLFYAKFDDENLKGYKEKISSKDLLIIDDFGAETIRKKYTLEMIVNLIDEIKRRNGHILITSNLSVEGLRERYTDRITSRLFDKNASIIIKLEGKDLRITKEK